MATMTLELPRSPVAAAPNITLDFRRLHAIKTAREYATVVAAIHALFDRGANGRTGEQSDLLEFLSVLAEAYEEANVEMPDDASPQEIVTFMLEQRGMTRADLHERMGGKARVSDFFNDRRPLSRKQMLALRDLFHIPLDLLVSAAA